MTTLAGSVTRTSFNMEDKGIFTDKNQLPSMDEERLVDSFGYFHSDSLITHLIPNTEDKQFSCFQCYLPFSKSGHLKKHKLVHTGEKQFACDHCDTAFSGLGNLKTHKLSHTGDFFLSAPSATRLFLGQVI